MVSKVFYTDMTTDSRRNLFDKTRQLAEKAGLCSFVEEDDLVAIKVHFGELGNIAFVPPPLIRVIVEMVREKGGKPFLTDANTLYGGKRHNAVDHIETALKNGFAYETVGAPIVIADGLKGADFVNVQVNGRHFEKVKISGSVHYADALIAVSHVKGHGLFGFGGALKNIGMGCGNPAGKQTMHADIEPKVDEEKCIACGVCIERCPEKAIDSVEKKKARINQKLCIGCGECVAFCPVEAIPVNWETDESKIQEKTAEYAWGVVKRKKGKCSFINYVMNVTPDCDCASWNDLPIVPDLGILASLDPVAIDQASLDLVNSAPAASNFRPGADSSTEDKFGAIHNKDTSFILTHGEYLKMGTKSYELESLWLKQNKKN